MGAFYNSICIPGDEHGRVRSSLLRWLGGRGFELSTKPMLFDLDGEAERCGFVISNEHWTILVFSKYEEERRLIRELQTWAPQILYLWIQDSETWGYDMLDERGFVGSFSSDPRTYLPFPDETGERRPVADPEIICQHFGIPDQAPQLRQLQRRKAIFKEEVCGEFCRLIGAEAALMSYDDLERGAWDHLKNWRIEPLLFVHRDVLGSGEPIDLHDDRLSPKGQERGRRLATERIEIPPEVLAETVRHQRRSRLTMVALRPVSWLARRWQSMLERTFRAQRRHTVPRVAEPGPRAEPSDVIEVRHLLNERHRCQIRLMLGGELRTVSRKPASVFSFEIGGTQVTCTARRRSAIEGVLQRPGHSKVLRDEKTEIGGLKARHLLYELPPHYLAGSSDISYLGLHVIQTEPALYVFLYRFQKQIATEIDRAIRATVQTFELVS